MSSSKLKTEKVKLKSPSDINLEACAHQTHNFRDMPYKFVMNSPKRRERAPNTPCLVIECARRAHVSPHTLDREDSKFRRHALFRKKGMRSGAHSRSKTLLHSKTTRGKPSPPKGPRNFRKLDLDDLL